MRRRDREITDNAVMERIIAGATICRCAFCDDRSPYIVPLNFGYVDKTVYAHCAREGRKLDIIGNNPAVCVEFEGRTEIVAAPLACDWTMRYESVLGFGTATLVDDTAVKRDALSMIMRHYSNESFEYPKESLAKILIIKIRLDTMTCKVKE